jgi:hypothetical protein
MTEARLWHSFPPLNIAVVGGIPALLHSFAPQTCHNSVTERLPRGKTMSDDTLHIGPSTKVAELLDAYPELEERLIAMAPPFKKLKNPVLRKSVAKVATLQQAAIVGRVDVSSMIDQLRQAVGQAPIGATTTPTEEDYLGTAPEWFDASRINTAIDDRTGDPDEMAITRVSKALKDLPDRQVIELTTTFLPAPGIDVAKTYFSRSD